ncbi:hypothetical protein ACFWOB_16175 [Streptomyces sp. NPDC058420]|uniref:hypothetical protein n=1 Tax=Streptomyces sp. NPDC058420 TaxID=3346489 RepID=UPI003656B07C
MQTEEKVLPYSVGAYAVMAGDLRLMEFDDAPPTTPTGAVYSGNLLEDPLRAAALSPERPWL